MKVFLLYPNHEFEGQKSYENQKEIIKDLNLDVIFRAAARELSPLTEKKEVKKPDVFIEDVMRKVMMVPMVRKEEVLYRQNIVRDSLTHQKEVTLLYGMANAAWDDILKHRESLKERHNKHEENSMMTVSKFELIKRIVEHYERCSNYIKEITQLQWRNEMLSFFNRFQEEYNPEFSSLLKETITDMEGFLSSGSITYSATLGQGMKQLDLKIISVKHNSFQNRKKNVALEEESSSMKWYHLFYQPEVIQMKEETILREAQSIENRMFEYLLAYFDDFVKNSITFFEQLHIQLAFMVGCIQLSERMLRFGLNYCYPEVLLQEQRDYKFHKLYELSMGLLMQKHPVSNSLNGVNQWLYIITGANQGGKSTYLRSIGIAQIMMQSGMFVPADGYVSNLCSKVFTHFTRREDSSMNSGRLDEELKRMDSILRSMTSDSLLLLNESFATTTEKEGSMIAEDLVQALYEAGIKICMVTHLLQFANDMYNKNLTHAKFLSAERKDSGERTYRMIEHIPSATSFGLDLYDDIIQS